jgi:hypothetical protein
MSTSLVKSEIDRFLRSADAEVLCIKGKWGVGKTFAWTRYVDDLSSDRDLGLKNYAYISLFGLNSLDALRAGIFENTVPERLVKLGPSVESFQSALDSAKVYLRKARPWVAPVLDKFGIGTAANPLSIATFLSVKNQIICFDDLERAGAGLELRDVLGLASMLKEKRGCKVVLLLNDQELPEPQKADFDQLLEKVVDTSLSFEPTAAEAAAIAFNPPSDATDQISEVAAKIGITNIRVLKKIERLLTRVNSLLSTHSPEIRKQAAFATTIAGWAVFESKSGPELKFLRGYNQFAASMREAQGELSQDQKAWNSTLTDIGYAESDDFDRLIIEGVERGYFDDQALLEAATKLSVQPVTAHKENAFSKAWDLYHGNLKLSDDEILQKMFQGALEAITSISALNLNSAITLFREHGRNQQADELIEAFMASRELPYGYLDDEVKIWPDAQLDPEFEKQLRKIDEAFVDTRDPKDVIRKMISQSGWNDQDVRLLSQLGPDEYVEIFESPWGRDLPKVAKFLVRLGSFEGGDYKTMGEAINEALKRIARKSPLKARRVKSYGVDLGETVAR